MQRESGTWMIQAETPPHSPTPPPLVYGVFCLWRLICVQPKLKLTCFLHALWSSVNVSWAAARVSRSSFSRRDYTQGDHAGGWQPAVVVSFSFLMTKAPPFRFMGPGRSLHRSMQRPPDPSMFALQLDYFHTVQSTNLLNMRVQLSSS